MRVHLKSPSFEGWGEFIKSSDVSAVLAYEGPVVPKGNIYNIEGRAWEVVDVQQSAYNKRVTNIYLKSS